MDHMKLRNPVGDSFIAPLDILLDKRLNPGARLLWLYLSYRTQHGSPPTRREIAEAIGGNLGTIRRWFGELENAAWISSTVSDKRRPMILELGDEEPPQ